MIAAEAEVFDEVKDNNRFTAEYMAAHYRAERSRDAERREGMSKWSRSNASLAYAIRDGIDYPLLYLIWPQLAPWNGLCVCAPQRQLLDIQYIADCLLPGQRSSIEH